jgi:hypothetical protein
MPQCSMPNTHDALYNTSPEPIGDVDFMLHTWDEQLEKFTSGGLEAGVEHAAILDAIARAPVSAVPCGVTN